MQDVNISRTIARCRRERGVTQEQLASHLGVTKAAVSKWELGQSLPDVALLPRIASYFSLTLDELFDWRPRLSEAEAAAVYASVHAEAAEDLPAAHARLMEVARDRWSDWGLLVTLATLLTSWAAGWAAPGRGRARRGGGARAAARRGARSWLDRVLDGASDPALLFAATQAKASALFQQGELEDVVALLDPLVRREDAGAATMLLASALRGTGRDEEAWELLQGALPAGRHGPRVPHAPAGRDGRRRHLRRGLRGGRPRRPRVAGAGSREPPLPYDGRARGGLRAAPRGRRGRGGRVGRTGSSTPPATDEVPVPAAEMPLFSHVAERLDPTQVSPEWSEHKEAQAAAPAPGARGSSPR